MSVCHILKNAICYNAAQQEGLQVTVEEVTDPGWC